MVVIVMMIAMVTMTEGMVKHHQFIEHFLLIVGGYGRDRYDDRRGYDDRRDGYDRDRGYGRDSDRRGKLVQYSYIHVFGWQACVTKWTLPSKRFSFPPKILEKLLNMGLTIETFFLIWTSRFVKSEL